MAMLDAAPSAFDRWVTRVEPGRSRIELLTPDVSCADCVRKVETTLSAVPGVAAARVNLSLRRATVEYDPARTTPDALISGLDAVGHRARPFDTVAMQAVDRDAEGRDLLARMAVAGFAAMNVMLLSVSVWSGAEAATRDLLHWISALITLPAVAYSGVPFYRSAWSALRARRLNMDVPISLAVWLAAGVSLYETASHGAHAYFDASVTLLFFLLIGRFLDHRTRRSARVAAAELIGLQANSATRLTKKGREVVAVEDLFPGDRIEVAAGDRIPADGIVTAGRSDVDRSLITGESAPEAMGEGAEIHAGMLNLSGPLTIRVTATGDATLLAEIARMIETAERAETRYTRWADLAARIYAPAVHIAAALAFAAWFWASGDLHLSVMTAAAVLIITCPCALGLAVPAVHAAAGGRLYRSGVFLKDGGALERLATVDTVIFDKTGTLTTGEPTLTEAPGAEHWPAALALAAASRHPYARALISSNPGSDSPEQPSDSPQTPPDSPAIATDIREVPGCGVEGIVNGVRARLGRADWCGAEDDGAAVWLSVEGQSPVRFGFTDTLKPGAADVVAALKAQGLGVRLFSGDAPEAVRKAAEEAGIDDWSARMMPAEKLNAINTLSRDGRRVLMVGDGVNDAPALAAADVSMSPARAADVSRAAAGLVFTGPRLDPVVTALNVARGARRRAFENFALAAAYNLVAIPAAAFGFVTPLIAALAMSGSSVVVTLNALRLRGMK
jgi:Cu2+-exporting ATPase